VATTNHSRKSARTERPRLAVLPVILAFVLGVLAGHLFLGNLAERFFTKVVTPSVSLSEAELDDTVATYEVNGKKHSVTYREAILENGSLDAARNADGSYRIPSADSVLALVRGQILVAEAEKLGISVSQDEIDAYAQANFGTTSLSSIASMFGMEEEAAAGLLREAAIMSALRDQAMQSEVGAPPEPPAEPAAGEEVTMTPEYAAYIISLAGDEWNGDAGTWASDDGDFAAALADYEVTSNGATYDAARQAFFVAYQHHVSEQSAYSAQWTDYVNELLGKASITISTLAV